jgi:multiple sugar transport system permease protein
MGGGAVISTPSILCNLFPEGIMTVKIDQPKQHKSSGQIFRQLFPYGSVLPALIIIALFTIFPVLYAIRTSVYQYILTKPNSHPFIGLKNFQDVLTSYYFHSALINTLIYTFFAVIGVIIFGLIVGSLLNTKLRSVNFLKIIILLPWAIPAVVAGLMWKWILNSDFGIFNGLLYSLGIIKSYIPFLADPNLAKLSLILAHVWKEGPLVAIFVLAGLQLIPKELFEAAKIDGGGSWRVFRFVTLPLLRPILLVVVVYETMTAILTFDIVYVLTGGGPGDSTALLSWFAYAEIYKFMNLGGGIALSIIIALITLVLIILYMRVLKTEDVIY